MKDIQISVHKFNNPGAIFKATKFYPSWWRYMTNITFILVSLTFMVKGLCTASLS